MKAPIDLPVDERHESRDTNDRDIPLEPLLIERSPPGDVLTGEQRAS